MNLSVALKKEIKNEIGKNKDALVYSDTCQNVIDTIMAKSKKNTSVSNGEKASIKKN